MVVETFHKAHKLQFFARSFEIFAAILFVVTSGLATLLFAFAFQPGHSEYRQAIAPPNNDEIIEEADTKFVYFNSSILAHRDLI